MEVMTAARAAHRPMLILPVGCQRAFATHTWAAHTHLAGYRARVAAAAVTGFVAELVGLAQRTMAAFQHVHDPLATDNSTQAVAARRLDGRGVHQNVSVRSGPAGSSRAAGGAGTVIVTVTAVPLAGVTPVLAVALTGNDMAVPVLVAIPVTVIDNEFGVLGAGVP